MPPLAWYNGPMKRALTVREGRVVPGIRVDGIEYTTEAVEGIRLEVIRIRDEALKQAAFDVAVSLSWVIAYLAEYGDLLYDPRIDEIVRSWRRAG